MFPSVLRLALPSNTLPPFEHSNTYLVHDQGVGVLIDAGFKDTDSLAKIEAALEQAHITFLKALVLTHTHRDHCAGLPHLQARFPDMPVYVHPNELTRLDSSAPLRALNGGRTLTLGNKTLETLFTPGHSPGHLSFYLPDDKLAFVGDLVASEGSTWVGLPEGDLDAYLSSLERLRSLKLKALLPGHGEPLSSPYNKLNEVRSHRLARLEQVKKALDPTPLDLEQLLQAVYPDIPEGVKDMARSSLLALLKKLMQDMKVLHLGKNEQGPYALKP